MPFFRFACVIAFIGITLAVVVDFAFLYLARKLGGFGFAAKPWQWVLILGLWWVTSILTASYVSGKAHIRPF